MNKDQRKDLMCLIECLGIVIPDNVSSDPIAEPSFKSPFSEKERQIIKDRIIKLISDEGENNINNQ